jgi:transposase InsO family protein
VAEDEDVLTSRIVALASEYGRYGYRRITAMLRQEGWQVNHKRVERIWRREGLKVPAKQPKCGRLGLNDGSIVRLRAEFPNTSGVVISWKIVPTCQVPYLEYHR